MEDISQIMILIGWINLCCFIYINYRNDINTMNLLKNIFNGFLFFDTKENSNNVIVDPLIVVTEIKKVVEKFEDKYLEKYNNCPNEYFFSDEEIALQKLKTIEFDMLLNKIYTENMLEINNNLKELIALRDNNDMTDIMNYYNNWGTFEECNDFDECNDEKAFSFRQDPSDDNEKECIERKLFYEKMLNDINDDICCFETNKSILLENHVTSKIIADKVDEFMVNAKLDLFINNYIIESTPVGNVLLRYNNKDKGFEYFSNNTIPYRYLETIGRKYVITFKCKPLFINLKEELDKSQKKKDIDDKCNIVKIQKQNNNMSSIRAYKSILASKSNVNPSKSGRIQPQVSVTPSTGLLKENANRYKWCDRLSNFNFLKKVPPICTNKNINLSYAEFKKKNIKP